MLINILSDMQSHLKAIALDTFNQTLSKMKPEKRVSQLFTLQNELLRLSGTDLEIDKKSGIWVIGAGKAAARMASGLESVALNFIKDGIVISPKGVSAPLKKIQILPGSHPKPDENSQASALEMIDFCKKIPAGSTVICLISGGTSSLMETPADGITLEEIRKTYDILLKSGASIHDMNVVRKHLSAVKGGKLLNYLKGTTVVNILLSDVPGDDPHHIGSGPTNPEPTQPKDALDILKSFGILEKVPRSVQEYLAQSFEEDALNQPECEVINVMAGTSLLFAEEASQILKEKGWTTHVAPQAYDAPIEEVASDITKTIKKAPKGKQAYLFHGESTVDVSGNGKGGRNQHLALLLALKNKVKYTCLILSAGTDGGDGPTDAAGAVASGTTIQRASEIGLDAEEYVANFDAYHFFKSLDDLIFTGPTGNNLMDFQLILTEK